MSERGFCCLWGGCFVKITSSTSVHLGTRGGEPCMGARSWAWVLNEIKIRVDKRVSKGLLISLLCFIACDLWVCVCVFFDSRLLFFSGFQNKRSVSSSEVCERRLQMLPHTCCCLLHNFSERIYADRAIHRPIAQPQ